MSIEYKEQLRRELNEALGIIDQAVDNLDINDQEVVEKLTKSILEASKIVEVRETVIYTGFESKPNENGI